MLSDKEIKKVFKKEASKDYEKYYPVSVLLKYEFSRYQCQKCGKHFWSKNESEVCGDSACSGGFRFLSDNPCKYKLSFPEVWKKFSLMFKDLGYTPIKRYPIVARWRADMEFTIASIADFQPYVVNGDVQPPANPLVVPQFCLRFGDIDNVGITASHMTCFNMIGQHMFVSPAEWNQNKVFEDIKKWINDGLGIPDEEVIFHEDAWAGGGNFGPCMEFFSRGVELGNQVYMLYEQTKEGRDELKLKVLDMGMGMERCAWFTQSSATIYDATFPLVIKRLMERTGLEIDHEFMKKYVPYAGYLNVDEVEDINKAYEFVAEKVGYSVSDLKEKLLPSAALYSVAEHARGLLIALTDSGLPSNTGGGYNLRVLARRALSFIEKYDWNIDLFEVCEWHAEELKEVFPDLSENLDSVKAILENEVIKFKNSREKGKQIISRIIDSEISTSKLIELYDSHGIDPYLIQEEAKKLGKAIIIPDDFYKQVSEKQEKEKVETVEDEEGYIISSTIYPETEILYYDDYSKLDFTAIVKGVEFIKRGNKDFVAVILDKTYFYAKSGGQDKDRGLINGIELYDLHKRNGVMYHIFESGFGSGIVGSEVTCQIDKDRRIQLTQHHSATHVINAAARKVLGNHINQAGAKKTVEKAHIDLTHFSGINDEEMRKIEAEANRIVQLNIKVHKEFMGRTDAEVKYGMRIYQGGAVPGNTLRIVNIPEVDVEACGGTHVNNTQEIGLIKIVKTTKIQDGVVRLEFKAGKAAEMEDEQNTLFISEVKMEFENSFSVKLNVEHDSLDKCAEVFKVSKSKVADTVKKFVKEYEEFKTLIDASELEYSVEFHNLELGEFCQMFFNEWKKLRKLVNKLKAEEAAGLVDELQDGDVKEVALDVKEMNSLVAKFDKILLINGQGSLVFKGSDDDWKRLQELGVKGGGKDVKNGRGDREKILKFKF